VKTLAIVCSLIALAATIVPPLLFMRDVLTLEAVKVWMLAGTVVWFAATPAWMER
jgi:hypothetical protein